MAIGKNIEQTFLKYLYSNNLLLCIPWMKIILSNSNKNKTIEFAYAIYNNTKNFMP